MRTRLTIAIVATGVALAGCGSDEEGKPIPQDVAADIDLQLDKIQGQIDQGSLGACNDIKKPDQTFEALQGAVERVPSNVDQDVRDALVESVERLSDLIDEECSSREPEQTETITIPTVPEETVPEETVPEETVPEETVPEEEREEEESPEQTPGLGPPEGGTGPPSGGGGGSGGVPAPGGGE